MRIVLDTNVVLSALLWRGTPYHLLETIRAQPRVQLCSSAGLLEELADVLSRPSPAKRLALIGQSARDLLADYVSAVELIAPQAIPHVVPDDPDDDHVIAAAVAARADLLVTGDSDLLSLGSFGSVAIMTAAQAVQRIAA